MEAFNKINNLYNYNSNKIVKKHIKIIESNSNSSNNNKNNIIKSKFVNSSTFYTQKQRILDLDNFDGVFKSKPDNTSSINIKNTNKSNLFKKNVTNNAK